MFARNRHFRNVVTAGGWLTYLAAASGGAGFAHLAWLHGSAHGPAAATTADSPDGHSHDHAHHSAYADADPCGTTTPNHRSPNTQHEDCDICHALAAGKTASPPAPATSIPQHVQVHAPAIAATLVAAGTPVCDHAPRAPPVA